MKIQYLGTGAAEGIPALFCNCEYCREVRSRGGREIRSRAQVLIDGELSIDFPPDAFYHAFGFRIDFSAIRYLLVTHSHADHFYAHDFTLRGYKYAYRMAAPALDIFGNEEVTEVYGESVRREMKSSVGEKITLTRARAFEPLFFGEYAAYPLKAKHSSRDPLLYLIEKGDRRVLHLTDTGTLPDEDVGYLRTLGKKIDLVTYDCTFLTDGTEEGARHMGLDENLRVREKLTAAGLIDGNTREVLTHFSHNSRPSPERLKEAEKLGFIAAYDGMTLEI